uniref:Chitin-binding type-1 domain-containing protein n=1 Tax=Branchiostoma floridae TaxID=7739 RepID=C3XQ50_BRAFL|eukprot:XP_002614062.1 hypothetical protein BRAFLDRAFT_67353 [Branchiostoma floridae]
MAEDIITSDDVPRVDTNDVSEVGLAQVTSNPRIQKDLDPYAFSTVLTNPMYETTSCSPSENDADRSVPVEDDTTVPESQNTYKKLTNHRNNDKDAHPAIHIGCNEHDGNNMPDTTEASDDTAQAIDIADDDVKPITEQNICQNDTGASKPNIRPTSPQTIQNPNPFRSSKNDQNRAPTCLANALEQPNSEYATNILRSCNPSNNLYAEKNTTTTTNNDDYGTNVISQNDTEDCNSSNKLYAERNTTTTTNNDAYGTNVIPPNDIEDEIHQSMDVTDNDDLDPYMPYAVAYEFTNPSYSAEINSTEQDADKVVPGNDNTGLPQDGHIPSTDPSSIRDDLKRNPMYVPNKDLDPYAFTTVLRNPMYETRCSASENDADMSVPVEDDTTLPESQNTYEKLTNHRNNDRDAHPAIHIGCNENDGNNMPDTTEAADDTAQVIDIADDDVKPITEQNICQNDMEASKPNIHPTSPQTIQNPNPLRSSKNDQNRAPTCLANALEQPNSEYATNILRSCNSSNKLYAERNITTTANNDDYGTNVISQNDIEDCDSSNKLYAERNTTTTTNNDAYGTNIIPPNDIEDEIEEPVDVTDDNHDLDPYMPYAVAYDFTNPSYSAEINSTEQDADKVVPGNDDTGLPQDGHIPSTDPSSIRDGLKRNPMYVPNTGEAVHNTSNHGQPALDTTYTHGQLAVDITYSINTPVADTTFIAGHPAVDTANAHGQPAVDTTYTNGQSAVDTTYTHAPKKKWRDDLRCGVGYPADDGNPAECDPDGEHPCCSVRNWCGGTTDHCDCPGCIDYRNKRSNKKIKYRRPVHKGDRRYAI